MKIAVCDDEKNIREQIGGYIGHFLPDAQVCFFESGDGLLNSRESFDLIYLDIKMSGTDGMETARTLRKNGCRAVIVFVTALEDHVYQAFDVGAFHYLLKPIEKVKFYEVLRKAQEQCETAVHPDKGRALLVKSGKGREKVFLSDIICAEVFDRKIVLRTVNGDVEYYGRIGELEKTAGSGFFRPHRAYLINLRYVSRYNSEEVILDKGRVPVSKRRYPEFVKSYLLYIKEAGNE